MVKRICTGCGAERYSAHTGPWICDVCGAELTSEHDVIMTQVNMTLSPRGKGEEDEG
jgi:predicted amidophosphoribosyltransferase